MTKEGEGFEATVFFYFLGSGTLRNFLSWKKVLDFGQTFEKGLANDRTT
jgi:hypothetical protein